MYRIGKTAVVASQFKMTKVAEHSFQEPMPNSPWLLNYLCFGAHFLQESRLITEVVVLALWQGCVLYPWQRSWLKTRLNNGFCLIKKNRVVRLFSSFANYELTLNPFYQHCSNKILTKAISIIRRWSFPVLLKIPYVEVQIFRDRSFTWSQIYFLAKFLEILKTGSLENGTFLLWYYKAIGLNFSSNCACVAFNWVLWVLWVTNKSWKLLGSWHRYLL